MNDDIVTRAIAGNWHSVKVVVPPDTPFTLRDEEFYKPMTDDIVTRLRVTAYEGCSVTDWTKLSWDIQEAADEIERLRLILTHICDVWGSDLLSIIDEMNRFKKEIK